MPNTLEKVHGCNKCFSCTQTHFNNINNQTVIKDSYNKSTIMQIGIGSIFFLAALFLPAGNVLRFPLFLISYLSVGGKILLKAFRNISSGKVFDENFLMSVATICAFLIGEYSEGCAVMIFYQIGELIQDHAVRNSRKSIAQLMNIRPDFANVSRENRLEKVAPENVKIGELIIVRPGEKIPLDGIVDEGSSYIDTSALTGESMPREVEKGSSVLAGFVNIDGALHIKVAKEYCQSTVERILKLVENAGSRKAKTERFITRFARYYTPIVVIIAAIISVFPPLILQNTNFYDWLYRSLVFLVISCPCALVISVPISFFGGIGGASKNGILIKGGNYLEALANMKTVAFDKTGTLTKGRFEVNEILPFKGNKDELIKIAAYAEFYSNHPISKAIQKAYGREIDKKLITKSIEIAGQGVKAVVEGKTILAGNEKLMYENKISFKKAQIPGSVLYLAQDGEFLGYITVSDNIKEDSYYAIESLKKCGINKTVMLTGDREELGKKVAKELNIDEVYTNLLPTDKVDIVEELLSRKAKKSTLGYIGDGINDAPVLARADVGIAMGAIGSDAAIEAADVVIMTDEPSKLANAIRIARKTIYVAKQNIFFALSVKFAILLLGILGFASMWAAIFADVGVSVIATLNAIRPLYFDLKN